METVTIAKTEYQRLLKVEMERNRAGTTVNTAYAKLYEASKAHIPNKNIRRRLIDDLKWDLRIRHISNITEEQLPAALEYIESWTAGWSGTFDKQLI